MAYGKKYHIDYKSMADEDYTLEFWVDGFSGSSTEINLGGSGPEIKYETSGQEKFTYILASSLDIPFIVEDAGTEAFITDLRDGTYEEKDVYVHLFNDRSTTRPLWSGFLLMDLAAKQDVSFPYEVKLTATDGLSLLKDRPFVRDTNTDTGAAVEFPYEKEDVYWNNYTKITNWIEIILLKTGSALSAQGCINYTYKTSINWYNSEMPSTNQTDDPLFWTQCKMNSLYDRDENGIYTPKSTYEVLEALCKSWGMRCVYWHHTFHFVQIAEYEASETGTPTSQDNINTREYYYNGGRRSDEACIGESDFGLYDLQFENVTNVNNAGLQKLAGTQYDFYAPIKKVKGNFLVFEDDNKFQGFPALDQTTNLGDLIYSKEIGNYIDADEMDGFYCQIPLIFTNIESLWHAAAGGTPSIPVPLDMQMCFSIRAREAGTTPWTKMLNESGTTFSWVSYTAPTSTNGVPNDMINHSVTNIPNGSSQRVVWDSAMYDNGIIPTDAAFTGEWEFEFFTYSEGLTTTNIKRHGRLKHTSTGTVMGRAGSAITTFDYSDVFDGNNNFTGIFAEITSGAIGVNNIDYEHTSSTSDSYTIKIDDLYWGESSTIDAASSLRVWNGSAFVKSNPTGTWGKGTTSGTNGFNELLAVEIMKCQNIASQRMNVTSALSETDKLTSTKLKMVNPVGRLKDVNSEKYVFLSGTYSTLKNEWSGVWFQFTYDSGLVVTTTNEEDASPISGPVTGGGAQGNGFGNGVQSMMQPWGATTINQRITAGSITSLNISTVNEAIIYSGDRIYLTDNKSGENLEFVVSANVGATDTTISVVAKTITEDIREGTLVGIDNKNLFEQYQRKTEGQVAGFDIDADGISKGGVEITGWLDSDTFTGANSNNVPTAKSVKAYVDSGSNSKNFACFTCSGTALSSATDGSANAVVVPFDTDSVLSTTNTITSYGSSGVSGVSGSQYAFSVAAADLTYEKIFEFSWNIAFNTSVVNNRVLMGARLQRGVDDGGTMVWTDLSPTTSYAYNRGVSGIRYASTANGTFIIIEAELPNIYYFRLVFWKEEASNASTKGITETNGTNFRIKQID